MMKRLGLRISYFVFFTSSLRRCSSNQTDIVIPGKTIKPGNVVILRCTVMLATVVTLGSSGGALQ